MSVRSKLIASSIVEFIVIAAIIAGILLAGLSAARNEDIVRSSLLRLTDSLAVSRSVSRQLEEARQVALSGQSASVNYTSARNAALQSFNRWKQSLHRPVAQPRGLPDIRELNLRDESILERQYKAMDKDLGAYLAASAQAGAAATVAHVQSVQDAYEADFLPRSDLVISREEAGAAQADRDAKSASRMAALVPLIISPIGLAIIAGISIVLIRDITGSLSKLKSATDELREGDLDVSVDIGKKDEFGELARSFNEMARELKSSTEDLKRANIELEGYAQTVSHDLKGPLATLVIACSILRQPDPASAIEALGPDGLEEVIAIIERSVGQAVDLIDNLLALAEAGQAPGEISEVDVSEVVRQVLEERAADIAARGVKVEVDEDLGTVLANRTHVYQVFTNLIGNSIKYGDSGAPVIKVSGQGPGRDGARHYRVQDNGPGIPPEALEKVFDPFFKGSGGGTGIGLAIVQKIVQQYGGAITVVSDGGARFDFELGGRPPSAEGLDATETS
jgi:signal transduction histidine kinase